MRGINLVHTDESKLLKTYADRLSNGTIVELGSFCGFTSYILATSAKKTGSKLYCIDPWQDYNEYPEYKHQQPIIYSTFLNNVENSGFKEKIFNNLHALDFLF